MGELDEEGYLYLRDRKIDMIITGGVNVYPAEVEAALLSHPEVGDAAVFGIPNEEWGEEVKAVVEPAPGIAATAELAAELIAHCESGLARYKCPRSIDFTDAMPRDPNGKLYKRRLRDPYWVGRERRIEQVRNRGLPRPAGGRGLPRPSFGAWLDVHCTDRFRRGAGGRIGRRPESASSVAREWNQLVADAGYAAIAWPKSTAAARRR